MSGPRTYEQLLADAVAVLTEAARHTTTWTDRNGQRQTRPVDWAEFVTLALAGAAANIGSIEQALSGRSRSWEAAGVQELLLSTVGYDEQQLLAHRTKPLIITVAVSELLDELGVWELYEQAYDELIRRGDAIYDAFDPNEVCWVEDPCADVHLTREQKAALAKIERLHHAFDQLARDDWAAYGAAFAAKVHQIAGELLPNLPVPVEVDVHAELSCEHPVSGEPPWGPAYRVWERARGLTPLPGSGIPLRDYRPGADIAELVRAAGRDPLSRLEGDQALAQ